MNDSGNRAKWFYQDPTTREVEGPFDLVELAGLLATGDITGETLMRSGESEPWTPFKSRREFQAAKDMPPGVIMRHLENKETEQKSRPGIFRWLYGFCIVMAGALVYAIKILFFAGHGHNRLNRWMEWLLLHTANHPLH